MYRSVLPHVRGRVYMYATLTLATKASAAMPRGVLVGTVEIVGCSGSLGHFDWHLPYTRRRFSVQGAVRQFDAGQ